MRVGARLFLSLVPAILGVFTVAGLAYRGQYDRQAPHVLVITAVIASVASLIMTWVNTRYVANKVKKLAEGTPGEGPGDELDRIEQTVDRLSGELERVRAERNVSRTETNERIREYTTLLADATGDAMKSNT